MDDSSAGRLIRTVKPTRQSIQTVFQLGFKFWVVDQRLVVDAQYHVHVLIAFELTRQHIAMMRFCFALASQNLEVIGICYVEQIGLQRIQGRHQLFQVFLDELDWCFTLVVVFQSEGYYLILRYTTATQVVQIVVLNLLFVECTALEKQCNRVSI